MENTAQYKCPCCDGAITFDAGAQKMVCPFCRNEFDVETLKSFDDETKKGDSSNDDMKWESSTENSWQNGETDNMAVYSCESCGGEIIAEATTGATSCPFCGNPVIIGKAFAGVLKPDFVIPFKLDKAAAKAALASHFKGKRLLPKVFKDENHLDEVRGLYVPFWLFDSKADANMQYNAQRISRWSDSRYNYTKTSHYLLIREGSLAFDKIPVDGSSKMPDDLMESIEPYDYSGAVDFTTAYLSGYLADKYDVDIDHSINRANERVKASAERAFSSTTRGYTAVIPRAGSVKLSEGKVRYALMPVWILNTTWNDNKYIFAMNGQTGKFVGNLPLDKAAFTKWFIGLTLGIAAALSALFIFLTASGVFI